MVDCDGDRANYAGRLLFHREITQIPSLSVLYSRSTKELSLSKKIFNSIFEFVLMM